MIGERIAVVGLGYVGLPVAVGMAREHGKVVGFDVKPARIAQLRQGEDVTREFGPAELRGLDLYVTDDASDLESCTCFIVTVPTPIDDNRQPDLRPLRDACSTIGRVLRPGAVVVFESTVYPGVTEEFCGPLLAEVSGLQQGIDFALGYSPERINPGDRERRLETIVKVVAASDAATLRRIEAIYGPVIAAGLHVAPSIKVAEAAKVIENTQRDLNIALMNELAIIFDRLGIRTRDVLEAAGTKWNFLRFSPGLVGGHCIGVDPYYLTAKAESSGYHPEVILAGRRINDGMGCFIARKLVKLLARKGVALSGARVAVLGLSFKENVPDLRNSRVPDILRELDEFGVSVSIHDPLVDPAEAQAEFGFQLTPLELLHDLDALVLAVPHRAYLDEIHDLLPRLLHRPGVFIDVRAAIDPAGIDPDITLWSL